MVKRTFDSGYTLIEFSIALAIISILAVVSFYGLKNTGQNQAVVNTQLAFLADLRNIQNGVSNGANGDNVKYVVLNPDTDYYVITGLNSGLISTKYLPPGVNYTVSWDGNPGNASANLCFVNRNLVSLNANDCGPIAPAGSYFSFLSSSPPNLATSGRITVQFTNGGYAKSVYIEGSGMQITRIYAQ